MKNGGGGTGISLLKKIAIGTLLSIFVISGVFIYNNSVLPWEMLVYETISQYNYNEDNVINEIFSLFQEEYIQTVLKHDFDTEAEKTSNNTSNSESIGLIGLNEVRFISHDAGEHYYDECEAESVEYTGINPDIEPDFHENINNETQLAFLLYEKEKQEDFEYLKNLYIIETDKAGKVVTEMSPLLFDKSKFLNTDLKINKNGNSPKILIITTHSTEMYADSDPENVFDGIMGIAARLKEILYDTYGIISIHHTERYDVVDGVPNILDSYARMEVGVKKILEENPSIEIVIDLHRDGVAKNKRLVTEIDGKQVAQIMFVNGLSSIFEGGELIKLDYLPNYNQETNLALSFVMQETAIKMYDGFARKIYLKPYRYSLHMTPKSLLVEIGAQTNTIEEALNAIWYFAEILAKVIL